LQASANEPQALFTRGTTFEVVNGLAPMYLTASFVDPQLLTPTTWLGVAEAPDAVPVNVGRTPKFTIQLPPLDPPHIREPIIVLFAESDEITP
jgi:hypothetical protein